MLVPLIGYAPDLDPTTEGVLTNCSALIPSIKGMKGAPAAQNTALPALAAACQGAAAVRKLDDTKRFFAGTGVALYEASAASWTDRTRASGGAYSLGTDIRWRFAQFGDVTLATCKSDIVQYSSSGAFANIGATQPKASIVETVGQFVFLFDVNDQGGLGSYGDSPDRWWCAPIGTYADFTPSVSTQGVSGRITSSPGKIVGGKRFGQSIIAYKQRSMHLGVYKGPPDAWEFTEIPGQVGALSHEAIVSVGTPEHPRHIFMGYDNFYSFDGSAPVPIGTPLKETVFNELNKQYAFAAMAVHDSINSRIYFFYPVASSVNPDKCVVYNYRTDRWGRDDRTVEAIVEYISAGMTYDDLGSFYATYNDLPSLSYDSSFWTSDFPIPGIFNTAHRIQTLDGAALTPSLTTWDFGDDNAEMLLSRVKPRCITAPTSGTQTNYYRQNLGDTLTADQTVAMSSGRFDVLRTARWHRVRHDYVGNVELTALDLQLQPDGEE